MALKRPISITANSDNLKNVIVNFNIALLFNQNDIDAEARKKIYVINGDPRNKTKIYLVN